MLVGHICLKPGQKIGQCGTLKTNWFRGMSFCRQWPTLSDVRKELAERRG